MCLYVQTCVVIDADSMSCPLHSLMDLLAGSRGRRRKRSTTDESNMPSLMFDAGIILDGVTKYSNFSHVFPTDGTFHVYDDPEVFDFDGVEMVTTDNPHVIIQVRWELPSKNTSLKYY